MVCLNDGITPEERRLAMAVNRAALFGIGKERAEFLAKCPYKASQRVNSIIRGEGVEYDPNVQLREAARLGINAQDAAVMMGWEVERVLASGVDFPAVTTHPLTMGASVHNLLGEGPE